MWTNCIWKAQGREKHVANIYVIFLSIYNLKEFVGKKNAAYCSAFLLLKIRAEDWVLLTSSQL